MTNPREQAIALHNTGRDEEGDRDSALAHEGQNVQQPFLVAVIEREPHSALRYRAAVVQDVDQIVSGDKSVPVIYQPLDASREQSSVRIVKVDGGYHVSA